MGWDSVHTLAEVGLGDIHIDENDLGRSDCRYLVGGDNHVPDVVELVEQICCVVLLAVKGKGRTRDKVPEYR